MSSWLIVISSIQSYKWPSNTLIESIKSDINEVSFQANRKASQREKLSIIHIALPVCTDSMLGKLPAEESFFIMWFCTLRTVFAQAFRCRKKRTRRKWRHGMGQKNRKRKKVMKNKTEKFHFLRTNSKSPQTWCLIIHCFSFKHHER